MPTSSTRPNLAGDPSLATPVVFDFDGALQLARRLAALADDWEQASATYGARGRRALGSWTGPTRDRVEERLVAEGRAGEATVHALRAEADRWARAWAGAADDLRHQRWLAAVTADPAGPPVMPPAPAPVPIGPSYDPTVDVASGSLS